MTAKRRPADVLREARKRDSLAKRARVLAVVDDLKATGEPITFLGVAKAAGASSWLVYAEGVRAHIEAARTSQKGTQRRERQSGTTANEWADSPSFVEGKRLRRPGARGFERRLLRQFSDAF
ncbi:hypothetical protein [Amycolatopsis sp. H20-H5]|uniref:hypothetical protein n=1 Tax=Amycolatopsis sp. H20-H5 TaxID=3046309 RepID=UPI002DB9B0DC|nr:hypothetical protein [Amycolatopsis sp. H20-H5]MEC3977371.1 hypothetical protein [Amycolatopsis sp. H20-H5]